MHRAQCREILKLVYSMLPFFFLFNEISFLFVCWNCQLSFSYFFHLFQHFILRCIFFFFAQNICVSLVPHTTQPSYNCPISIVYFFKHSYSLEMFLRCLSVCLSVSLSRFIIFFCHCSPRFIFLVHKISPKSFFSTTFIFASPSLSFLSCDTPLY